LLRLAGTQHGAPTKAGDGPCCAWQAHSTANLLKRLTDPAALGRHTAWRLPKRVADPAAPGGCRARRTYQSGWRILLRLAGTQHGVPTKAGDGSCCAWQAQGTTHLPKRATDPQVLQGTATYQSGRRILLRMAGTQHGAPTTAGDPATLGGHATRRDYQSGRQLLLRLASTEHGAPTEAGDGPCCAWKAHRARFAYQSGRRILLRLAKHTARRAYQSR
jgi:hypothetical protein